MPINTAGAKAILDIITTHPALYDQGEWAVTNTGDNDDVQAAAEQGLTAAALLELDKLHNDGAYNTCGTTFCVAGWGTMLSGYTLYRMSLGRFAQRFGTDLVIEMYSEHERIAHAAQEADYARLNDLCTSTSFYRDPNGQWMHNGYGPQSPSFGSIGARFLGLTTPHGAHVADRLFRSEAGRDEVIEALTALAEGRYPTVLVESELKRIDALLDACLEGQYDLAVPTAGNLTPDDPERTAEHERVSEDFHRITGKTRELARQMAGNLRQMRRLYTLDNLTDPAPKEADLTATINA